MLSAENTENTEMKDAVLSLPPQQASFPALYWFSPLLGLSHWVQVSSANLSCTSALLVPGDKVLRLVAILLCWLDSTRHTETQAASGFGLNPAL